jgi:hypothetical protein
MKYISFQVASAASNAMFGFDAEVTEGSLGPF